VQNVEHTPVPRLRVWLGAAVLAAVLGIGVLALGPTQGRHALLDQLQRPATPRQTAALAPAPTAPARFVRRAVTGDSLIVTLTRSRANGPIGFSIHIAGRGPSLTAAQARVSFRCPR